MAKAQLNPNKDFGLELGRFVRAFSYLLALLVLCFFIFMVLAYMPIASCAFYTYDSYQDVPARRVGLLLGTSSNVGPGQPNDFFTNRIMAAANLYHKGKIEYILVSGDNRHESYNEPRMMMNALLKAGVPLDRIVADFAGFSTLDSVLRARQVFMLSDMLIISQDFHNERAIFIARAHGIPAIGFNAANPSSMAANIKVKIREFFARLKCIAEVYLLDTQPTYLGAPIAIGNAPLPKQPTDKAKYPTSKPKEATDSAAGLKMLALEELKRSAKQPTDSALILRQQQRAMSEFQKSLLSEPEDQAEIRRPSVPMSSPVAQREELEQMGVKPVRAQRPEAQPEPQPDAAPEPATQQPLRQRRPRPQDPDRVLFGDPWE